ncbi:hypothetical protein ACN47E_001197 [Coniothyrium glycines]
MAARPNGAAERVASHGRGGAGNIVKEAEAGYTKPEDLVTPTLKFNTYTTGRGGSGNMAKNDPDRPELARAAQDVDATPREPEGPKHYGRGGAANIITEDGQSTQRKSAEAKRKSVDKARRDSNNNGQGIFAKGKEFLNKLGKK